MAAVHHTADHPLEAEVVGQVERYLKRCSWPFDRLPVTVVFGLKVNDPSKHKLKARIDGGRLLGEVRLFYNYLFLHQHPGPFIDDIVPHEVAHVLARAQSARSGKDIKEHGVEWRHWLQRLTTRANPRRSGPGHIWDDRAIRMFRGGLPVRCDCPDETGFAVISARQEQQLGEIACQQCEGLYRRTTREDAPASVQFDYEFICDEQSSRQLGDLA